MSKAGVTPPGPHKMVRASDVWICTGDRKSARYPDIARCHSIDDLDPDEYELEDVFPPEDSAEPSRADSNEAKVSAANKGTTVAASPPSVDAAAADISGSSGGRIRLSEKLPAKKLAPEILPKPKLYPRHSTESFTTKLSVSKQSSKDKPDVPPKRVSLSTIVPFRVKGDKAKKDKPGKEILVAMKKQSLVSASSEEDEPEEESDPEEIYFDWSSGEETWRESREDSSIYQNVDLAITPPKDKAHRIANELMTTEEAYVKKLEILQQAFRETSKILGEVIANEMFPSIDSICKLHKENLFPFLKERLTLWESSRRIGDIMKTFAPFLKLYTDYVKNYDQALQLIEQWNVKSKDFSKMLSSLPSIAEGHAMNIKLQITSHMLEPIQRVPRYELLLRQYMKQLTEDSPDYNDVKDAVVAVSEAAKHFEETMKQGSVMVDLIKLQQQIDSPFSIISPGRHLLKQGKLAKVNATTGKVVQRFVYLFNDLFLICCEQTFRIPGVQPKYNVRQMMDIDGMQITQGDNVEVPYTFYVKTQKIALELSASSEQEKDEWQKVLWKTVGDRMKKRISRAYSLLPKNTVVRKDVMNCRDEDLGKQAPVWVHNSQVTMCQHCAAEFKGFRKKHHCRACGMVVCAKCSSQTFSLEYDQSKDRRVCDECFFMLVEHSAGRVKSTKKESHFLARSREVCSFSGFLQLSQDEGKSWQKQWCEIHEGGVFFAFKAQQDMVPAFSVVLESYQATICSIFRETDPKVIRLTNGNDTYYLKEETPEKLTRWSDLLNGGT